MVQNSSRLLRVGFVAATVLLVVVSLGSAAYFQSTNSALMARDQEVLHLRAVALTENLTILRQQLTLLELNSTLLGLNMNLMWLQNESAFMRLELSAAEQVGKLAVVAYFANVTFGADPGTSIRLTAQANGHNGTLVLLSSSGCPISGDNLTMTGSQNSLYIWLNSGSPPAQSGYYDLNRNPFTVFLQNKGPYPVSCKVSLLFVQH